MSITLSVQLTDFNAVGTVATVLSALFGAVSCFINVLMYKKN